MTRTAAVRPRTSNRRTVASTKIIRWLLALLVALGVSLVAAPARADSEDVIKQLAVQYTVQPSGVLHVRETFDWEFGCCESRHGIQRELITREPDPDHPGKDVVYKISNVTASSPDGVSTMITEKKIGRESDRTRSTVYRIGDPGRYVFDASVTYVLSYDVVGALRHFADHDELYWDVTGTGNPPIEKLTVRAGVPGGAQQVRCFAGPVGSTDECSSARISGRTAVFAEQDLPAGENVTVGVWITPGLISDNAPHLVNKASIVGPRSVGAGLLGLALTVGTPVIGWLLARRWMTDDRYLDLPPGTLPDTGGARVGPDPGPEIPVAFTPPDIPVAEAVQLMDNKTDERITAATIVELAARGVITVEHSPQAAVTDDDGEAAAAAADDPPEASAADQDGEAALTYKLNLVGDGDGGGAEGLTEAQTRFRDIVFGDRSRVELTPGELERAHAALTSATLTAVQERGWFAGSRTLPTVIVFGLAMAWFAALVGACWLAAAAGGGGLVAVVVMFVAVGLITMFAIVVPRVRRGKRTADGRAVLDQVEGFSEYLATAEAEQLKFEEGQDIFSRYLPWAIAFGLATRWQQLCQQLVELGRLPDRTPDWYSSPTDTSFAQFHSIAFASTVTSSLNPPPPVSTGSSGWGGGSGYSGTGFGSSSSSFSGGGFSGGGGGGGGSSSW